jgi:hypothetical protein
MKHCLTTLCAAVVGLMSLTFAGCSDDNPLSSKSGATDSSAKEPVYSSVQVTPDEIKDLSPILISGDANFSGHGPDIVIRASLTVSPDKTSIGLTVEMTATETAADWTTAHVKLEKVVYTAEPGWVIDSPEEVVSASEYIDHDIFWDHPDVSGPLIGSLVVNGDNLFNDIGQGFGHTRIVKMTFNRTTFILRQV